MLWWVLGFACIGLLLLALAGLVFLAIRDGRRKAHVIEHGDAMTGWLVQANSKLFSEGALDYPALVLLSPDPQTAEDEEFMTELAAEIMDLKGVPPDDCDTDDEAEVARLMADETYVEGKRDRLPKRFAKGREVHLTHIFVYREHLRGGVLDGRRLNCAVVWDDPKSLVCTRPAPRRRRRGRADRDDE